MLNFDAVIIGAGAAGLMCAATAASRGRKILLIDHAKSVGEKIRISGGGRCNFTNLNISNKNFLSKNSHFCLSALHRFTSQDFISLVKKHKIPFHEKTLGQLFCDKSSQDIIEMLLKECALGSAEIWLETKIEGVSKVDNIFTIKTSKGLICCKSLVVATGGLSIPKMGATGFGYDLARQFKIKVTQTYPALVPFTFDEKMLLETKILSGISALAIVTCGKISFRESVLFTHRGISGPAILQISSYWQHGEKILINFAPEIDIYAKLIAERSERPKQEIKSFLAQFLAKNLADFFAQKINHRGNLADLSKEKMQYIARLINSWSFIPSGTEGYLKAEVTMGGVDVNEISSQNFESKKVPNLFFIGEVLDVTGWLGGYNFQWAWSSGKAAGDFV